MTPESALYNPKLCRIMLVDDEPVNLKLFALMLRSDGYQDVVTVQDPRQVVAAYREVRPDLILLDINMPHMDGYQVMAALKALGDPVPPPIVVLTAQSTEDHLLRALDAGATDFLPKPVGQRELLARTRNILLAHLALRCVHGQNAALELVVEQRTRELSQSRLDLVRRLSQATEFRDNETGQHILRMSHAAALLAQQAGWDQKACALLLNAAPLHDLGKIAIPDGILLKPGPLTAGERQLMQTHAQVGADLLSGSDDELICMAHDIALGHHERWDGTGYPNGLAGVAIPASARIVAIADVFDALTSSRPYKRPWPVDDAVAHLNAQAGRHFDPTLVAHFQRIVPQVVTMRARFDKPLAEMPG